MINLIRKIMSYFQERKVAQEYEAFLERQHRELWRRQSLGEIQDWKLLEGPGQKVTPEAVRSIIENRRTGAKIDTIRHFTSTPMWPSIRA